ncbi:MAG: hypothetical protein JNL70_16610 [Saprospiraceae bacterium]|nr:hypothetical protein [Saprospiraceae bacterium]
MEMKNNEQHTIDVAVRKALENLEVPYKADHWQSMASRLDALDAEESAFDHTLASHLAQVEVPLNAAHWDKMSAALDKWDADDSQFDQSVGSKIAQLEAPFQPTHWADMSSRLDDLDAEEVQFDAHMRRKLMDTEVRYQPMNWDLMAEKIEDTFSWRRKIVRYKVVEVALVLLTLFTVGNAIDLPFDFVRDNAVESETEPSKKIETKAAPAKQKETKSFYNPNNWRNRSTTPTQNTQPKTDAKGQPIVAVDKGLNLNIESNTINNTTNKVEQQPIAAATTQKNNESTTTNPTLTKFDNQTTIATSDNAVKTTLPNAETNKATVSETTHTEGVESISLRPKQEVLAALPLKKAISLDTWTTDEEQKRALEALGIMAEVNPVDILKPSLLNTDFYDDKVVFPRFKEKATKWRLNVFGLPTADHVTTNYILERKPTSVKQTLPNIGAGLAVGYKKGRVELESGVSYLEKQYNLPNISVTTGSFLRGYNEEKPQNLRLSIASIPLSMNYTVKENNRWRFYARIGSALNAILKSKEDKFIASTNQSVANYPYDPNVYEPNIYSKGILEEGLFVSNKWLAAAKEKTNTYITANAGIGIEYRLTRKTDIYLQPTFDYHISKRGIGTLNDRINTFSVQGGVKTKLK